MTLRIENWLWMTANSDFSKSIYIDWKSPKKINTIFAINGVVASLWKPLSSSVDPVKNLHAAAESTIFSVQEGRNAMFCLKRLKNHQY
jgi:hypothetical protein